MRLIFLVVLLGGCTDPISYSAPIALNFRAMSADTTNEIVSMEKSPSNPYFDFVSRAMAKLDGAVPSTIELDHVELALDPSSTGVTRLGEVFTGDVEIGLEMHALPDRFWIQLPILETTDGPVGQDTTLRGNLSGPDAVIMGHDYLDLVTGQFTVFVKGRAAAGFSTQGAEADLQATLHFTAYE